MQGLPVPCLHSSAGRATGPGAPTLSLNFTISLPNHLNVERTTWLPTLQKPVQHENIGLRVQTSLISRWPSSRPGPACPPGVGWGHVCKASPSVARGVLTRVVGEGLVKDRGSQAAQSSVCTTVPPLLSVVTLDRSLGPSGPQFPYVNMGVRVASVPVLRESGKWMGTPPGWALCLANISSRHRPTDEVMELVGNHIQSWARAVVTSPTRARGWITTAGLSQALGPKGQQEFAFFP